MYQHVCEKWLSVSHSKSFLSASHLRHINENMKQNVFFLFPSLF